MNNIEYCVSRYFVGLKVEVGIPLPNSQTFRDWAIINEIDEDLVSLQLSRDILPDGVSLRVGQVLTIRSERDGQAHTCRCFIVSMGFDHELLLRLTSEIFSGEMREFFRVDAFLPITYQSMPDQTPAMMKKQWEARRKLRQDEMRDREQRRLEARRERLWNEEQAREQKPRYDALPEEPAGVFQGKGEEEVQDDLYDELLVYAETLAVTISGGGLKISTSREFGMDEFILLEIFVPSSRLILDVVARVVFTSRNANAGEDRNCFDTGMKFVYIEEFARHAINSHLSSIQLRRIRHFKGFADVEPLYGDSISSPDNHYAYINGIDVAGRPNDPVRIDRRLVFQQVGLGLFFVFVFCLIGFYFSGYAANHPKNEIQKSFENGVIRRGNMANPVGRSASGG